MLMNEMTKPNSNMNSRSTLFKLVVRQQPCKARLCSFKEKVDRRPIDPPPIIQLQSSQFTDNDEYLQNPYFFLYATLTDASGETDLHFVNGNRTTAGTVVQSLHKLKDVDNTDGGFFIFSDISIRLEGFYRLKFTLYEIEGPYVNRITSVVSEIFQVYSPKSFPGMSESTFLTRSFSDQGVRIRIRKEPRSSSSNTSNSGGKRRRKTIDDVDMNDSDDDVYMETSPMPRSHPQFSSSSSTYHSNNGRSPSPLPDSTYQHHYFIPAPAATTTTTVVDQYNKNRFIPTTPNSSKSTPAAFDSSTTRPTLPSPKEIFSRSSPMSMSNILSSNQNNSERTSPPLSCSSSLFSPPPSISTKPIIMMDHDENSNGKLFATRKLPLPLPSSTTTTPALPQSQPPQQHHHYSITSSSSPSHITSTWLQQQQYQQQRVYPTLPLNLPPLPKTSPPSTTSSSTSSLSPLRRYS